MKHFSFLSLSLSYSSCLSDGKRSGGCALKKPPRAEYNQTRGWPVTIILVTQQPRGPNENDPWLEENDDLWLIVIMFSLLNRLRKKITSRQVSLLGGFRNFGVFLFCLARLPWNVEQVTPCNYFSLYYAGKFTCAPARQVHLNMTRQKFFSKQDKGRQTQGARSQNIREAQSWERTLVK